MSIQSITQSVAGAPYQNPVDGKAVAQEEKKSVKSLEKPQAAEESKPNKEELGKSVQKLQDFVSMSAADVSFSIDEASGIDIVKVVDRASKEVIRQIPSKEVIALSQALDRLQGLFVRDKA